MLALLQIGLGAIKGEVIDTTGAPLRGAAVEIVGSPAAARTDSVGAYRIDKLPVGHYVVHVGHVARPVDVKADTAVEVLLMARDVARPKTVWVGCQPFRSCNLMRYVATFREHDIPQGIGVVRDSTAWAAFLAKHATGSNAQIRDDVVDWKREMLVIVSYGTGSQPLDPGDGINRVEKHTDRLTVLLGPDSSGGPLNTTGWIPATVVAVQRTTLPVEYRGILASTHVPPTVDWSRQ